VLEQAHLPFEAIVLHSHSVEYVLEQLEESPYRRDLKFVVVGSEPVPNVAHQLNVHVVLWDELVKQGSQGESVQSNTPGMSAHQRYPAQANERTRTRGCLLGFLLQ
jgi:hypothetical protein